jgi:[CysO sulfur-carrier protein]-S-L-cysteine hydrolase
MLIAPALLDELIGHAVAEAPNECCGVVSVAHGDPPLAVAVHRLRNTAASPLRFEVDPLEHLRVEEAIDDAGHRLGAIYHSHTRTAPYPSQTDINFAVNWGGVEWIIIGVADLEGPDVRSYLIAGGEVTEVPIEIAVS